MTRHHFDALTHKQQRSQVRQRPGLLGVFCIIR